MHFQVSYKDLQSFTDSRFLSKCKPPSYTSRTPLFLRCFLLSLCSHSLCCFSNRSQASQDHLLLSVRNHLMKWQSKPWRRKHVRLLSESLKDHWLNIQTDLHSDQTCQCQSSSHQPLLLSVRSDPASGNTPWSPESRKGFVYKLICTNIEEFVKADQRGIF